MTLYRLLITDVTDFGKLRCVAGWDLDREKMIRPQPAPRAFWPASAIGPGGFERGVIVEFKASKPAMPTGFPHQTEDRVVTTSIKRLEELAVERVNELLLKTESPDLDTLFDGNLHVRNSKAFVLTGTECASLGAIGLDASDIQIFEDKYEDKVKLRCAIPYLGGRLVPSLTSSIAHAMHRKEGLTALKKRLVGGKRVHLRMGLARGFAAMPDRCYLQVNGITILK